MIQFNCPLMQKLKTISIQRRPGTRKHQARVSSTQNSPCTFPPSKVESSVPMMPIKPSCRNNHHIMTAVLFAVPRCCYLLKSSQKGAIMINNAIAVTKTHATCLAYFQQSMRLFVSTSCSLPSEDRESPYSFSFS
jgi:hypothetical protein